MGNPIFRIENVIKRYDSGFTLDIPHLEFQTGKIYGLIGPNGAGKTTLMNILNLLEEPDSGAIFYNDRKLRSFNSLQTRRKMTMVMENPLLFSTTVFKNITVGLRCRSINKKQWPGLVDEALGMVNLRGFENRRASGLSRGEVQRVAMARALVLHPDVMLLDEPFTNIDKKNVTCIEELIRAVNHKHQTTILFSTHDLSQANRLSDELIALCDGKTVNSEKSHQ